MHTIIHMVSPTSKEVKRKSLLPAIAGRGEDFSECPPYPTCGDRGEAEGSHARWVGEAGPSWEGKGGILMKSYPPFVLLINIHILMSCTHRGMSSYPRRIWGHF